VESLGRLRDLALGGKVQEVETEKQLQSSATSHLDLQLILWFFNLGTL
jgi:hypothetical protein